MRARSSCERGVTIGYLPQESAPVGDETVIELATAITPEFAKLRRIIKAWEADHPVEALHSEEIHDDVHDRFNELGGYQLEAKAKQILAGLSFREKDFDRPAREMSGGWVMRAHLARLLVQEPDLLLLDEPTNHLDLEALLWFQEYLKSYPGAILVISHDREFLNQLVGSIVEIRQSKLIRYRGNYDDYLVQREAAEEQLLAAYKNQQREIGRMMEFVDRFRAKTTKAAQAQSKLKQIERMEKIEAPTSDDSKIDFSFPQPQRSGLKVIKLEGIHQAYGSNVVYRGMDFEAERGQRIVLVGPNGAGKSTLLKILAGVLAPQSGERTLGHNVKAGYYSQYRVDMLNPNRTVLEEALRHAAARHRAIRPHAARLFSVPRRRRLQKSQRPERWRKEPARAREAAARSAEPAAHGRADDAPRHVEHRCARLRAGAIRGHAHLHQPRRLFHPRAGQPRRPRQRRPAHALSRRLPILPGQDQSPLRARRPDLTGGNGTPARTTHHAPRTTPELSRKDQKRLESQQRQASSHKRKAQQQLVHSLEKQIQALEARQAAMLAELEKQETYNTPGRAQEINRELVHVQHDLAELNPKWEEQATRLAALE